MKHIILASASKYRCEQLKRLNIAFSTLSPDIDEAPLKAVTEDHIQLSRELALLKAKAISNQYTASIVIGGDQVASFNKQILSKPKSKEKALEQLTCLAGQEHQLITSLAIISDKKEHIHTCIATMKMRPLSDEQLSNYIEHDKPFDCCGSYKLEALGISLFEKIDCPDYTSIIGIPLMWTAQTLSKLGVSVP